jgi:hypothetical protein
MANSIDDELDFAVLEQITAGRKFLTAEEEASIYKNYSGSKAKQMAELMNQKRCLEEIKKEQAKDFSGGRGM